MDGRPVSPGRRRRRPRRTLQAGREALEVEEQQLLGTLDAGRQARLAEQRKLLGDRTAAERQPILTEMDRLQREADTLEREHTARLNELDMHLGKVRDRVGEARRDYHNFKALRDQVNRALTGTAGFTGDDAGDHRRLEGGQRVASRRR